MNKYITFALGLAVGGAAGFVVDRVIMNKKIQNLIDGYEDRLVALEDYFNERQQKPVFETSENVEVNPVDSDQEMTPQKEETIKEKLLRNHEETAKMATRYDQMYERKTEEVEAEPTEEDEWLDDETKAINEQRDSNRDRGIEYSYDYGDVLTEAPGYFHIGQLTYYQDNDVMIDEEDGSVVDEYHLLVGQALEQSGFMDNDEEDLFVANYDIDCGYEISKVFGAYE